MLGSEFFGDSSFPQNGLGDGECSRPNQVHTNGITELTSSESLSCFCLGNLAYRFSTVLQRESKGEKKSGLQKTNKIYFPFPEETVTEIEYEKERNASVLPSNLSHKSSSSLMKYQGASLHLLVM